MALYTNSSMIGVDLNNADTTARFASGTVATASQDALFTYCETVGTFSTGMMGTISTAGTATPAVTSSGQAAGQSMIGFIQTSSTSGQFAWFAQTGNNVYIRVSGTCNASAVLYVATTSGCLHSTSASSTMAGIVLLASTSATATNAAVLANLTWPRQVTALA